jgi:hypothetical protein
MAEIATLTTRHGTLYRHDDTAIMIEDDGQWAEIGILGGAHILVDQDDWPAFVEMINAIDAARKSGGEDGPV